MAAPLVHQRSSAQAFRQEAVFTKSRLAARAMTKSLAPSYDKYLKQLADVDIEQNQIWDAQTMADAQIVTADEDLDAFIVRFHRAVDKVTDGKKDHPTSELYFPEPAYKLASPVLGSELASMKGWLRVAAKEKNAELKAMLADLVDLVKAGEEAEAARAAAASAALTFRSTGPYLEIWKSLTTLRDATWRSLEEVAEKNGLERRYPKSFFRGKPQKASEAEKAEKAAAREAEKKRKEEKRLALKTAQEQVKAALAGLKKVRGK